MLKWWEENTAQDSAGLVIWADSIVKAVNILSLSSQFLKRSWQNGKNISRGWYTNKFLGYFYLLPGGYCLFARQVHGYRCRKHFLIVLRRQIDWKNSTKHQRRSFKLQPLTDTNVRTGMAHEFCLNVLWIKILWASILIVHLFIWYICSETKRKQSPFISVLNHSLVHWYIKHHHKS